MRLIIEANDFQTLSEWTREELLARLAGLRAVEAGGDVESATQGLLDLTPELAGRLSSGLSNEHRRYLEAFARHGGRVSMAYLLFVGRTRDRRRLWRFQIAASRRLSRLLKEPRRRVRFIGWDRASEEWDRERRRIVDGTYVISPVTTQSLRCCFPVL